MLFQVKGNWHGWESSVVQSTQGTGEVVGVAVGSKQKVYTLTC